MSFWDDLLLSPPAVSAAASSDALFASLLGTNVNDSSVSVPSLVHSEGSSPESTESSEHSPAATTEVAGQKRKNTTADAQTWSQKDSRTSATSGHTQRGAAPEEAGGASKVGKAPISEKRRDQNRAAQRAFRERKEKHVKDLEERVAMLETVQRERDLENDNLRDLVNQLRKENERLGAGQNRFAQSSFLSSGSSSSTAKTQPSPLASGSASASTPAPVTSFPSMTLGGMGMSFLAELSGQPVQRPTSGSASNGQARSVSGSSAPSTASSASTQSSYASSMNTYSSESSCSTAPGPFESARDSPSSQRDLNFDDYFLGMPGGALAGNATSAAQLASTLPAQISPASRSPAVAISPAASGNQLCPIKAAGSDVDIDILCHEMRTKATCQEYARQALEAALQDDMARYDGSAGSGRS